MAVHLTVAWNGRVDKSLSCLVAPLLLSISNSSVATLDGISNQTVVVKRPTTECDLIHRICFLLWVTRLVSIVERELITLSDHLRFYVWGPCCSVFIVICKMFCGPFKIVLFFSVNVSFDLKDESDYLLILGQVSFSHHCQSGRLSSVNTFWSFQEPLGQIRTDLDVILPGWSSSKIMSDDLSLHPIWLH